MTKRLRSFFVCFACGAGAYWGVDGVLQLAVEKTSLVILLLTFVPPVSVLAAYRLLGGRRWFEPFKAITPLSMLLGIWAVGPLVIALEGIRHGGTFFTDIPAFLTAWAMFPLSTFVMSTYSGSLGGVIIMTISLVVLACVPGARRVLMSIVVGSQTSNPV